MCVLYCIGILSGIAVPATWLGMDDSKITEKSSSLLGWNQLKDFWSIIYFVCLKMRNIILLKLKHPLLLLWLIQR